MLRTRLPLTHVLLHMFVRLACLKHAASVHPEPGSNSQKESNVSCETLNAIEVSRGLRSQRWEPRDSSIIAVSFFYLVDFQVKVLTQFLHEWGFEG